MNETLKGVAHIGAELAAAKADLQREMERHRKTWRQLEQVTGLLREAFDQAPEMMGEDWATATAMALSQQAEPVRCEYCDGTGDVHRADGEWLGECKECDAAEPAPAQDERKTFEVEIPDISAIYDGRSFIPYRSLEAGERLMTVAQHLRIEKQLRAALTRPAQTEQPDRYTIGDLTYEKVFKAAGLTNLSDLQAVLDAVEAAIAQDSMTPEHRGCLRAATPAMDDQQ